MNKYIGINFIGTIIIVTFLRIKGFDQWTDGRFQELAVYLLIFGVSIILSIALLKFDNSAKKLSINDKKLTVLVPLGLSLLCGNYISALLTIPFFYIYCQNNIC
jgi:hypothetical protein